MKTEELVNGRDMDGLPVRLTMTRWSREDGDDADDAEVVLQLGTTSGSWGLNDEGSWRQLNDLIEGMGQLYRYTPGR